MEPIQPQERPEWVPRAWRGGRFNRWFWHSPGRVVVWLIAMPLFGGTVTVAFAVSGELFWTLVVGVPTVFQTAQSVVYAPRAWRAYRR